MELHQVLKHVMDIITGLIPTVNMQLLTYLMCNFVKHSVQPVLCLPIHSFTSIFGVLEGAAAVYLQ